MQETDTARHKIVSTASARRAGLFLLVSYLLTGPLIAQIQPIPKNFVTGQAAHFVLGQMNFSDITGGTSQTRLQALSGIAIAGNKLIVSDSTILAPPNNNRVLIYNNLNALKTRLPQDPLPPADVVLGQTDFLSSTSGTSAQLLNEPVGVASDGVRLYVADWGNNRVLIYNSIPEFSNAPADVVVGQTDMVSANAAAGPPGLRRPNGVFSDGSHLIIADTLNNRVLIYNRIPARNGTAADLVLGQPNFTGSTALPTSASTFSAPMSGTTDGRRLVVTDLANNRVLIYNSIPTRNGQAADVVVGQPDFVGNAAGNTQTSLDFPRYAYSDGTRLLIVDSGNNRILVYNQIPTQNGAAADIVIGQTDFYGLMESCAASNLAVPYAVASDGEMLYVSDSLNRRVLGFLPGPSMVNLYGVVNAASFSTMPQTQGCQVTLPQPPLAPGTIAAIFGSGLSDTSLQAPSLQQQPNLPTQLGDVAGVNFNGISAPILSVSPNQINVQVPFEVTGYSASMEISRTTSSGTVVSAAVPVGMTTGAPGIYTADGSGTGLAVMVHSDGVTPVTPDSPAMTGETVTVYATGLGIVSQYVADGAAASFSAQGSVTIGGTPGTGQMATIVINGVPYTYTMVAGDSLDQVTNNLATLINNNDPLVSASADIANEMVNLVARVPGTPGQNISYSASVPPGGTLTVSLGSPVAVGSNAEGFVQFFGTPQEGQVITITLAGTPYTYTPVNSDTIESVINQLVNLINNDVNVMATADVPDSKILLDLRPDSSAPSVTYTVDVEPPGSLTAVTDNPHLTPGVANVSNTVTATIGKSLPLVPGTVSFGGTLEPNQTVTITLEGGSSGGTPYSYTTTTTDTFTSLLTNLRDLINGDPNVTATVDTINLQISLALKNTGSSLKVTFTVTLSPGSTLIAVPQSTTNTGSESASVTFAGMVSGYVGLYQVNFTVPTDQAANCAQILNLSQNLIVFGSTTATDIVSNDVTFPITGPCPSQ